MEIKCLKEELLADYLEDRLTGDERSKIESHFSDCSGCLDEFLTANSMIQSRQYLEADPVPSHVTEAAVMSVAQIVFRPRGAPKDRRYPFLHNLYTRISEHIKLIVFNKNRFAPVRGSRGAETSDYYRVRKMFKEILVEIEIEKAGHQIAAIRVTLIKGFETERDIRVTLQNSHQREIASYPISAKFVIFENIPFGNYNLVFMENRNMIGNYNFKIKESV